MTDTALTTQAVTVVNPLTREVLDVASATTADLAGYMASLPIIRRHLAEEEAVVNQALLERIDPTGEYTQRLDDGEWVYTLKTSSPTAGTDAYLVDVMRDGLREMLAAETVAPEASRAALKRTVTITATVDVDVDLAAFREQLLGIEEIGDYPVWDVSVAVAESVPAAGVARLRRMGGDAATLVGLARQKVDPPARKVRVTAEAKR